MKAAIIFFSMLIATVFSCFSEVGVDIESTPNVDMHGNVIQSCIVETFVRAVEHYININGPTDEIYVEDGNPLLTNEVIDTLRLRLKQALTIVRLANLKSNPKYLRDKLTKEHIVKWDIQLKLYANTIRVKVIPWGVSAKKKRGHTITPHVFVDWYIGRYEYDCDTNRWTFKNFEYGWI